MANDELENSSKRDSGSSDVARRGLFKWFVLVTYVIFSSSLAVSELIFAPIPKQMAAYYGVKGKYFRTLKRSEVFKCPEICSPLQCKKKPIGAVEIWVLKTFDRLYQNASN